MVRGRWRGRGCEGEQIRRRDNFRACHASRRGARDGGIHGGSGQGALDLAPVSSKQGFLLRSGMCAAGLVRRAKGERESRLAEECL